MNDATANATISIVEFEVTKSVGYTGNMAGKSWVAEIVGRDYEMVLGRKFLKTSATSGEAKKEMAKVKFRGRKKGSWPETCEVDHVCLIEVCDRDDRSYYAIVPSMSDPSMLGYIELTGDQVRDAVYDREIHPLTIVHALRDAREAARPSGEEAMSGIDVGAIVDAL